MNTGIRFMTGVWKICNSLQNWAKQGTNESVPKESEALSRGSEHASNLGDFSNVSPRGEKRAAKVG